MKRRLIGAAAAVALAAGLGVAVASPQARAATVGEIYLQENNGYCITPPNSNVGAQVVLGDCANANTQQWQLDVVGGSTGMIQNTWDSLCLTVNASNGGPDGEAMLQGSCVGAATQIFSVNQNGWESGRIWWFPDRQDYRGRYMALDDAGGRLAAYNPIDESYYCTTCASESWWGLANS